MTDLCRLIFWTLVDLIRSRATLEEARVYRCRPKSLQQIRSPAQDDHLNQGRLVELGLKAKGKPSPSSYMPDPSKSALPTDKRSGDFRSMKTSARAFAGKGAVLIARAT